MRNKILALFILNSSLCLNVSAQRFTPEGRNSLQCEEATQLMEDGHYYAASQSLKTFLGTKQIPWNERLWAEEQSLVCDYFLNKPGTKDRIQKWLKTNPQSIYSSRLSLLRANMLVRDGEYAEALYVYKSHESQIQDMGDSEREETLVCEAIANINQENYVEAEAILQSLQDCKTHQMDMVYYSGYVKYVNGNYADAIRDFQIVSHDSDYEQSAIVYLADCYLHTGSPQKSLSLLNNQLPTLITQKSPIDPKYADEIHRIRGEAYYDQKSYTKAIEALSQYTYNVEQPRRTALYKLGMSYFSIQEYAKAAPILSSSASTATDEMAQNAWLNAGICYVYSQNKKQAQIAFQQASEMDANSKLQEEALYNYALTLHEGNTMGFGESVNVFERFLNQFPSSQYASSVSKHLSEVYFTTKNYPAALESINKIKNPSAEIKQAKQKVLYNLGVQEFISGNYTKSDSYMAQAINLGSKEAVYLKGESEYRQGKYAQAETDLSKYVKTASKNSDNYGQALYSLGYSLFKQSKYNLAATYFNRFVSSGQSTKNATVKADALNRLADCQFTERQYDEAYATYQRAIDTDRKVGDYSIYQQAFIEGLKGNYSKKVQLLNQMGTEYAGSQYGADALYEQGRAYVQSGAKNEALQTFANVINKYPQSQKARSAGNEMAMIYQEAGMKEEALAAYTQVINSYPNTIEAQTALANVKDIYTSMDKIGEYAELAQKAGKGLSNDELDQMLNDAATRSMNSGNYDKAYQYYTQLSQQTLSADVQVAALEGSLRSAFAAKQYDTTIDVATRIIQNAKASQAIVAEALLYRAQSLMATEKTAEGIKDLQELSNDDQTVYGAQANVLLAQYAYDTNQYQASEQILQKFIESGTTHQYWLARAFILLSDVYMKTDRQVEAREYLLSLKSNYSENDEINKMIRERLK